MILGFLWALLYPQVHVSYEFHPKQAWPSHLESLTGNPWPIDSFWESNGLTPNISDIEKGERHFFFVSLSWDLDTFIFSHRELSRSNTERLKTQTRNNVQELKNQLVEELDSIIIPKYCEALQRCLEEISRREALIEIIGYMTDRQTDLIHT